MHSWRHKQFMYDVDINSAENQFVEISFNTLILQKGKSVKQSQSK